MAAFSKIWTFNVLAPRFRANLGSFLCQNGQGNHENHDLIFCSRPSLVSQQKLSYNGLDLAFSPYAAYWREIRKICMVYLFNSNRVRSFRPIREFEVSHMLEKITKSAVASKPNAFVGGTETSAATVVWAMTLLMKNSIAMKKAQEEVRKLIGMKGFVEEEDTEQLPYLKAVIKETMRAPLLIPRESCENCILGGYDIPAKTVVYVNTWAIGRDPDIWENPEEFDPERFINSSIDLKGQDFELIPFGAGRRICPGMLMGLATVEVSLANLLYKFDWEMPVGMKEEDVDMDAQPGLTMHKKNALCLMAQKYDR
ncbi:hypothetical protein GH714_016065 [Hevea brasiliensis]|uniref:Cytochrome P450 n=1 Tax=Hevea brasiliensis TaxID=3981 RepID=A0A6A6NHM8_HEVBR|nr:hypothetical protein GH714_016065 [Hevea brasiliensis]